MHERDDLNKQLDDLLAHLDYGNATHSTDEFGQQAPTEIIDVYIVPRSTQEQTDPTSVEGSIAPVTDEPGTDPGSDQLEGPRQREPDPITFPGQRTQGHRRGPRQRWPLVALVVALCLTGAGAISAVYVLPLLAPPVATVTIIPQSITIKATGTATLTTDTSTGSGATLPGRPLAAITMSQATTTPTTGLVHQPAQAASGSITFYNAATTSQTISVGTLLTGTSGVQIVTDVDAVIPAASMPTEGQVTVSAHAVSTGPAGNIPARDISGACCRLNVFAINGAFHGGQDARTYQTVTQQDLDGAAARVTTSLEASARAALMTQVHPDETLLLPLSCQPATSANHAVNTEATQVQVTVNDTCSGAVYSTNALQAYAASLLSQQVTRQRGAGYQRMGDPQTTVTGHLTSKGTITVQIVTNATYAYQFSDQQLEQMKRLVAGKQPKEATAQLLQVPGVASVTLSLNRMSTFPTDVARIHFIVLIYPSP